MFLATALSLWRRREESTPVCPQSDAQIDWFEEMPLRGICSLEIRFFSRDVWIWEVQCFSASLFSSTAGGRVRREKNGGMRRVGAAGHESLLAWEQSGRRRKS